jgi:hypothetical protein
VRLWRPYLDPAESENAIGKRTYAIHV